MQDKLKASGAWGFDLSAACCGFVYSLTVGSQFIASGAHERALVIGVDVMSSIVDYKDRATCVIFGDGAAAVLLEAAEGDDEGLIDYQHQIEGYGGQYLYMPGGGSQHPTSEETVEQKMHYVHQDGQKVFKYAVRRTYETTTSLLSKNDLTPDDVSAFHRTSSEHPHSRRRASDGSGFPKRKSSRTSTSSATPPRQRFRSRSTTRSRTAVSTKAI